MKRLVSTNNRFNDFVKCLTEENRIVAMVIPLAKAYVS